MCLSTPSSPMADRMSRKAIASGKRIDFEYFDQEGFSIGEWIRVVGCKSFCSMSERYYPHLIQEFYRSMAQGSDGWTT